MDHTYAKLDPLTFSDRIPRAIIVLLSLANCMPQVGANQNTAMVSDRRQLMGKKGPEIPSAGASGWRWRHQSCGVFFTHTPFYHETFKTSLGWSHGTTASHYSSPVLQFSSGTFTTPYFRHVQYRRLMDKKF
ncbi:unnamed protein product [Nesidiocoris tenuis]|uniref:Uncharacterized protein n=1 Tax=Nesidiocoris tenuis TaxID=355587 RepID=A0A6H5HBE2_9HEMI|nr:unnamed protein product [Nesidiocoris tenuis]